MASRWAVVIRGIRKPLIVEVRSSRALACGARVPMPTSPCASVFGWAESVAAAVMASPAPSPRILQNVRIKNMVDVVTCVGSLPNPTAFIVNNISCKITALNDSGSVFDSPKRKNNAVQNGHVRRFLRKNDGVHKRTQNFYPDTLPPVSGNKKAPAFAGASSLKLLKIRSSSGLPVTAVPPSRRPRERSCEPGCLPALLPRLPHR